MRVEISACRYIKFIGRVICGFFCNRVKIVHDLKASLINTLQIHILIKTQVISYIAFLHGSGLKFVSASRINNRFQFHEYTNILLSLAMRNAASAPLVDKWIQIALFSSAHRVLIVSATKNNNAINVQIKRHDLFPSKWPSNLVVMISSPIVCILD